MHRRTYTLRQVTHNLLKNDTSLKVGIQGESLQEGWRQDYLLKVLRSYEAIAPGCRAFSLSANVILSEAKNLKSFGRNLFRLPKKSNVA